MDFVGCVCVRFFFIKERESARARERERKKGWKKHKGRSKPVLYVSGRLCFSLPIVVIIGKLVKKMGEDQILNACLLTRKMLLGSAEWAVIFIQLSSYCTPPPPYPTACSG